MQEMRKLFKCYCRESNHGHAFTERKYGLTIARGLLSFYIKNVGLANVLPIFKELNKNFFTICYSYMPIIMYPGIMHLISKVKYVFRLFSLKIHIYTIWLTFHCKLKYCRNTSSLKFSCLTSLC